MSLSPLLFIALALALWAGASGVLSLFMVSCLLGASAVISLPSLGGAPITPSVFMLGFLVFHAWRADQGAGLRRALSAPGAGRWLLWLAVWGVLSALFVPRFLAGATEVFSTTRSSSVSQGVTLNVLRASTMNLTQTAYFLAGVVAFGAVRSLVSLSQGLHRVRQAVLLLCQMNLLAVALNLAENYLHLPSALDLLRNANYAIMVGGDIGGLQRISGTFPEASAWASFTLPLFAFVASLWADGWRRALTGPISLLTLSALVFSTSSTAYGALAVYLGGLMFVTLLQGLFAKPPYRLGVLWLLALLSAVLVCLALLLRPTLLDAIARFLQLTVFGKLQTSSGVERSSWNVQAWRNFVDVWGLGIGLGSGRASSFPMVLLSNLGVLGVALFGGFLAALHRRAAALTNDEQSVCRAARRAVWAALVAASVSAAVFDLGLLFYAMAAIAAGPVVSPVRRQPAGGWRMSSGVSA